MKMGEPFDPAMSREQVQEYLERAGLCADEVLLARIGSWETLQAFVARDVAPGVITPPIVDTRLRTYGLDQTGPLTLLARHVVS